MQESKIHRQTTVHFLGLIILSLSLFGVLTNMSVVQTWLSKASGEPANLVIDVNQVIGALNTPWRYFAQGGESPEFRLTEFQDQLGPLKPAYIRLDHLYDFYAVVTKTPDGKISVDWTKLDLLLGDLKVASATPMLALSYMPPALSRSGDITDQPQNWADWTELVRQTIEHVSGKNNLGIPKVYYEVWNEPDLFGQWKAGGAKNYFTLYEYTVLGANQALDVYPFSIGGPSTTSLYDSWITKFLDFVRQKNLRLDFYSWHIYSLKSQTFFDQTHRFNNLISNYPEFVSRVEPIITEWGPDSGLNPIYDNKVSAAHLVDVMINMPSVIHQAYLFELQDSQSPNGDKYWGRWGIFTSPQAGSVAKPRYQALKLLNELGPEQLVVSGQGTWVKALATKNPSGSFSVIVSNHDPKDRNTEVTPLTFTNLKPGSYQLKTTTINQKTVSMEITTTGTYSHSLALPPNSVVLVELISL